MRTYRLGDDANSEGWPFLRAGHAYLADGTPLTEYDRCGRIVPVEIGPDAVKKSCSGGQLTLGDCRSGLMALARALDREDLALAPILLLQLQIDPASAIGKFNQWHKPPGTGGGQFASGPSAGGAIQPVASTMHVDVNSDYVAGIYGEDIDTAHALVMALVRKAILDVGATNFRPGMPGYGQALHLALEAELKPLAGLGLYSSPAYLGEKFLGFGGQVPLGASVPDVIFGDPSRPSVIFELKTGRAVDTTDAAITAQRAKTLLNVPGNPLYQYIQVYEK